MLRMFAVLIVIWAIASTTEGACWALPPEEKEYDFCFRLLHTSTKHFRYACLQYAICNGCGITRGESRGNCDDMYKEAVKKVFCKVNEACIEEGINLLPHIKEGVLYEASPRPYCNEKWVAACFQYFMI